LRATFEELKGLPPALVIVDENDILRDQGEAYASKLQAADVATASVRFNGTMHDFMMLAPLRDTETMRRDQPGRLNVPPRVRHGSHRAILNRVGPAGAFRNATVEPLEDVDEEAEEALERCDRARSCCKTS
jgi:acetyl esterase/lipase